MGAFRKGLTISLGLITAQVDLHSVVPTATRSTGMTRLCPTHHQKLQQTQRCPDGDGHIVDNYVLGLDTPEGWRIPDPTDKPEVETASALTLMPVPAEQLAESFYGDSMYYMAPTMATLQAWQALYDLIAKGKIALVTRGSLRKGANERIWRITIYRECLVLRELEWPETINNPPDIPRVKLDRAIPKLLNDYVAGVLGDWSEFDTTNTLRARVEQWASGGELVAKPDNPSDRTNASNVPTVDLLSALQEAVKKRDT